MAHLLKKNRCSSCKGSLQGGTYYIHHPVLCSYYHSDVADQIMKNRDLHLATGILNATVGGGTLAVSAGRLAVVGKIGSVTGKCIGGALAGVGVITSVIDIVDAATEEAPALPKCKNCGQAEAEKPGCILVCQGCGVKCNDWRDASAEHHCYEVCEDCYSCHVCMKCNKARASRKEHQNDSKMRIHRLLSTHLYGTQKAGRITGASLSIAGTAACFIPVVGWIAGPSLIAGGVGTSIGSSVAAKPVVKIRCGECSLEDIPDNFDKSYGCQEWCATCGDRTNNVSKYCLALCDHCQQDA